MTVVRALLVPPDPVAIARRLADRPGIALLAGDPAGAPRPDDARFAFIACEPVEATSALVPEVGRDEGEPLAPRWIGVVPYEALRGLERPAWTRAPDDRPTCLLARPAWRRYDAVVRVDRTSRQVAIVADDERAAARLAGWLEQGPCPGAPAGGSHALHLEPDPEPPEAHLERVRRALALIAAGDLYEVNLARRIPFRFQGDALRLFERLLEAAPAPWSFLQDLGEAVVVATSPELGLSVQGPALRTCPIKGTRPRQVDLSADAAAARELETDPKERAELTMAIDVHRNDLGRVAEAGSVRVAGAPRVLGGRTVWSRVAEITARRVAGATLDDVVRAVLPVGSVTGAPKVRAMEVIARLEPSRRGLYTGAFGYVGRDGRLELAVAIRTLQLDPASGRGDYFAGGGIVADSVPERELEETRWKAVQLERLAGAVGP